MSFLVLTNARLFASGYDLTGASNKLELTADVEEKDVTTFLAEGDPDLGWKKVMAGLQSFGLAAEGFWEAGSASFVDDEMWADLGSVIPVTAGADGAAVADTAWLMRALRKDFKFGEAVGEVNKWTGTALGSWPLVRGKVLHPPGTARTTSGSGTAVEVSAVSASQYLYATLHVVSVSGTSTPTVTVIVESDADSGFASPTTRISFTAATAIGGQVLRTAGAITDTFFRVSWTISGVSPSFLFLATVGVK